MELKEALTDAGLSVKETEIGLRVKKGVWEWPANSCEVAVQVVTAALCVTHGLSLNHGELARLTEIRYKVRQYGALTAAQLGLLQRENGLLSKLSALLEERGFDLEPLYDQAPQFVDPPQNAEMIVLQVDALTTETAKAWLLSIQGKGCWFPKAACTLVWKNLDLGFLTAPRWMAKSKGLQA